MAKTKTKTKTPGVMTAAAPLQFDDLPEMAIEQIETVDPLTRARAIAFVCHGPDGHVWLLKRNTREAAQRDGLAYFLATRVRSAGRWYIADERGRPYADGNGRRVEVAARIGGSHG